MQRKRREKELFGFDVSLEDYSDMHPDSFERPVTNNQISARLAAVEDIASSEDINGL